MIERVILSGMGGQGIISLGNLIGYSAMMDKKNVSIVPSYGAEMRGGISNCFVAISDLDIGSPVFSCSDSAIFFYQKAVDKYADNVIKDGIIIYNEDMVSEKIKRDDLKIIGVPANTEAKNIGNIKIVNILLAGIWCKNKNIIKYDTMLESIEKMFAGKSGQIIDLNKKAFDFGYNFVK